MNESHSTGRSTNINTSQDRENVRQILACILQTSDGLMLLPNLIDKYHTFSGEFPFLEFGFNCPEDFIRSLGIFDISQSPAGILARLIKQDVGSGASVATTNNSPPDFGNTTAKDLPAFLQSPPPVPNSIASGSPVSFGVPISLHQPSKHLYSASTNAPLSFLSSPPPSAPCPMGPPPGFGVTGTNHFVPSRNKSEDLVDEHSKSSIFPRMGTRMPLCQPGRFSSPSTTLAPQLSSSGSSIVSEPSQSSNPTNTHASPRLLSNDSAVNHAGAFQSPSSLAGPHLPHVSSSKTSSPGSSTGSYSRAQQGDEPPRRTVILKDTKETGLHVTTNQLGRTVMTSYNFNRCATTNGNGTTKKSTDTAAGLQLPVLSKSGNTKSDLLQIAKYMSLGAPEFFTKSTKMGDMYVSSVKVGGKKYGSLGAFASKAEAENKASANALKALNKALPSPESPRATSPLQDSIGFTNGNKAITSLNRNQMDAILSILTDHQQGVLTTFLEELFLKKCGDPLPDYWLTYITKFCTKSIDVNKVVGSEKTIIALRKTREDFENWELANKISSEQKVQFSSEDQVKEFVSDGDSMTNSFIDYNSLEDELERSSLADEFVGVSGGGMKALMETDIQTPEMPDTPTWEIIVTVAINGPWEFAFRIIGPQYSMLYEQMSSIMTKYYSSGKGAAAKVESPVQFRLYAAEAEGSWHRCYANPQLPEHVASGTVEVYFLDHGDMATLPISSLRILHPFFTELPRQAMLGCLSFKEALDMEPRIDSQQKRQLVDTFIQLCLGRNAMVVPGETPTGARAMLMSLDVIPLRMYVNGTEFNLDSSLSVNNHLEEKFSSLTGIKRTAGSLAALSLHSSKPGSSKPNSSSPGAHTTVSNSLGNNNNNNSFTPFNNPLSNSLCSAKGVASTFSNGVTTNSSLSSTSFSSDYSSSNYVSSPASPSVGVTKKGVQFAQPSSAGVNQTALHVAATNGFAYPPPTVPIANDSRHQNGHSPASRIVSNRNHGSFGVSSPEPSRSSGALQPLDVALWIGRSMPIYVTFAHSPHDFWMQNFSDPSALSLLEGLISSELKLGQPTPSTLPGLGEYCVVLFQDGEGKVRWIRAYVLSIGGQLNAFARLFLCDYGEIQTYPRANLRPIRQEWAKLPMQAIRCRLAGVRPSFGAQEWSTASGHAFSGYVVGQNLEALVLRTREYRVKDGTCSKKPGRGGDGDGKELLLPELTVSLKKFKPAVFAPPGIQAAKEHEDVAKLLVENGHADEGEMDNNR